MLRRCSVSSPILNEDSDSELYYGNTIVKYSLIVFWKRSFHEKETEAIICIHGLFSYSGVLIMILARVHNHQKPLHIWLQ